MGADISDNQIAEAKRLSEEQNMDITYIVSGAEQIDFPDNTFDDFNMEIPDKSFCD